MPTEPPKLVRDEMSFWHKFNEIEPAMVKLVSVASQRHRNDSEMSKLSKAFLRASLSTYSNNTN